MKLYITGNGFDREHGLKTSYIHFRNYLEKYAEDFLTAMEHMYNITSWEKLDRRNKKNKKLQELRDDYIWDTLWGDFETCLGKANEDEMLNFSESIVDDMGLETGAIAIKDTMDQYWEEEYSFIQDLQKYVRKWIRQVRLIKATCKKKAFLNNNKDFFFTFNYTSVLERIYSVPTSHILHIHGGLSPYCEEPPVLGHGNKEVIERYWEKAEEASEQYDEGKESICNAIANYYKRTLKNTDNQLLVHRDFFEQLQDVYCVEVIGHSFSEVDFPYFVYLKRCVKESARWIFYYHSEKSRKKAEKLVDALELMKGKYKIVPTGKFWEEM